MLYQHYLWERLFVVVLLSFFDQSSFGMIPVPMGAIISPFPKGQNKSRLCSLFTPLINGTTTPLTLLKGRNLSIAVDYDSDPWLVLFNSTLPTRKPMGGLFYQLLQVVAKRGGFNIHYVVAPSVTTYPSVTNYLLGVLPYVDMNVEKAFIATAQRRTQGIGFSVQILDASICLIGQKKIESTTEDTWKFFTPWHYSVWGVVFAVCLSYSLFHYLIELGERRAHATSIEEVYELTVPNTTFQSFMDFSLGESGVYPSAWSSWMLRIGYLYFLYLMVASYVASLAGTLIERKIFTVEVISMNDASLKNQPICVMASKNEFIDLIKYQFSGIQLVRINTPNAAGVLQALTAGDQCVGAIISEWEWDVQRNLKATNPNCNLYLAQRGIRSFTGAWAYDNDYSKYCTTAGNLAISSILTGMKADGTYNTMVNAAYAASNEMNCGDGVITPTAMSDAAGLDFKWLSGIFYIYLIFLGAALFAATVKTVYAIIVRRSAKPAERTDKPPGFAFSFFSNSSKSLVPPENG